MCSSDLTLDAAAASPAFGMVVPSAVPAGLTPTVARYEPETYGAAGSMRLYLAFTTDSGDFVSVWQSNGGMAKVVDNATNGGTCETPVPADGWERCSKAKPLTRALVKLNEQGVVVVSGTADWAVIEAVRDSLTPLN